jgi:Tfp pilus assembly PilM family ATPase
LARLNEITSTERLLDLIRRKTDNKSDTEPAVSEENIPRRPPPGRSIKTRRAKVISVGKPLVIGVDIGHEYLRLVKTTEGANETNTLLDQRQVAIPPFLGRGDDGFADFLGAELSSFCGADKKQQIWAIMSAAKVDVHHIRIPKVPKKQIENAIFWTVKKETPFDEKENIFDFEVLGEVVEQGIPKYAVMYYTAPKQEVETQKSLFARSGWPLTGLSITPFAVQNILRTSWIPGDEGTAASLFIGNDFSRIDIYSHGNLVMTRGIKAGISSMLESLMEGLSEKAAATGTESEFQNDKDSARKILFSLSSDSPPLKEGDAGYGLKKEEIWEMILYSLERLARQVERTFEHYTINLENEKVDKIYVSAAMNLYPPAAEYVGQQLGIASDVFDPLSLHFSGLYEGDAIIPSASERIAFAPALGIALSDNMYTPNLLFTYKDKEIEASVKRINWLIFIAFIISVSVCAGGFFYQLHAINQKTNILLKLEKQLSQYNPQVNRDLIFSNVAAVKHEVVSAKNYSQRYQGMAIISELSRLASPDIRLTSLKAKLGGLPDKPDAAAAQTDAAKAKSEKSQVKPKEEIKEVEIEGFVFGEQKSQNTSLASYIMKLDNSPLFQQVKVQNTTEEHFKKAALLRFVITMSLEGS